jgi:hypothetical protein
MATDGPANVCARADAATDAMQTQTNPKRTLAPQHDGKLNMGRVMFAILFTQSVGVRVRRGVAGASRAFVINDRPGFVHRRWSMPSERPRAGLVLE